MSASSARESRSLPGLITSSCSLEAVHGPDGTGRGDRWQAMRAAPVAVKFVGDVRPAEDERHRLDPSSLPSARRAVTSAIERGGRSGRRKVGAILRRSDGIVALFRLSVSSTTRAYLIGAQRRARESAEVRRRRNPGTAVAARRCELDSRSEARALRRYAAEPFLSSLSWTVFSARASSFGAFCRSQLSFSCWRRSHPSFYDRNYLAGRIRPEGRARSPIERERLRKGGG